MSKVFLPVDTEFIFKHHPELSRNLIADAFDLCKNKERAIYMSDLIIKSRLGARSILAAILIDANEAKVKQFFGNEIYELVVQSKKLINIKIPHNIKKEYDDEVATMLVAFAKDLRVLFLAIIYTVYLLEFTETFSRLEIKNILRFIGVISSRLNIWKLKMKLEDLCLQRLAPEKYVEIERKINRLKYQRSFYINLCLDLLREEFKKHQLEIITSGRIKHIYSIYKKIELKKVPFEEIYDLIALRIVVNAKEDCYKALGIVHNLWMPQVERIKDYIAVPKPNNYQSLHTTVIGPENQYIEIQIRTKEMEKEANFGIAAHWVYSQNKRSFITEETQSRWVKSLLNLQNSSVDFTKKIQDLRIDYYDDLIFVFTGNGQVFRLPKTATAIDLAYSLSTHSGNYLKTAEVNGQIFPPEIELKNADLVTLILEKKQKNVQAEWLKIVKTDLAKSKIKEALELSE